MDFQKFETDERASNEGVWVPIGGGAELKVARSNNDAAVEYRDARMKPYRRQQQAGIMDDAVEEEIIRDTIARHVLLDWRGMTDDGEEVPYSREEAEERLKNDDFLVFVAGIAADRENFREQNLSDAEGN